MKRMATLGLSTIRTDGDTQPRAELDRAPSLRFRVCTDVMEVGAGALAVMRGEVASSSPAPR